MCSCSCCSCFCFCCSCGSCSCLCLCSCFCFRHFSRTQIGSQSWPGRRIWGRGKDIWFLFLFWFLFLSRVCAHFPRSAYSLESPLIPESLLLHESTPKSGTDPAKHKSFKKLQHHAFEGGQLGPDVGNWSACRLGLALRDSRVGVSRDLVSRLKVE